MVRHTMAIITLLLQGRKSSVFGGDDAEFWHVEIKLGLT